MSFVPASERGSLWKRDGSPPRSAWYCSGQIALPIQVRSTSNSTASDRQRCRSDIRPHTTGDSERVRCPSICPAGLNEEPSHEETLLRTCDVDRGRMRALDTTSNMSSPWIRRLPGDEPANLNRHSNHGRVQRTPNQNRGSISQAQSPWSGINSHTPGGYCLRVQKGSSKRGSQRLSRAASVR